MAVVRKRTAPKNQQNVEERDLFRFWQNSRSAAS